LEVLGDRAVEIPVLHLPQWRPEATAGRNTPGFCTALIISYLGKALDLFDLKKQTEKIRDSLYAIVS